MFSSFLPRVLQNRPEAKPALESVASEVLSYPKLAPGPGPRARGTSDSGQQRLRSVHQDHYRKQQLKPSFNNCRLKLPASAQKSAPRDRSRRTKRQARHGDSRIFAPGSRQSESRTRPTRRNQDLLAPVLRQGVPPLPAGTALHARPGSRLARQARGVLAPAFELSISSL